MTETAASGAPTATGDTTQIDEIRAGYAFDGAVLKLGRRRGRRAGPRRRPGADPAQRAQPARPRRGRHRHRQDQDAPAHGRAAVRPGRPGLPRRHEGRPVRVSRRPARATTRSPAARPTSACRGRRRHTPRSSTRSAARASGISIRATITSFGPTLLSKVLGLNDTQESSLGLIFHYADKNGLALLDLKDLRAVITHLTSDEGKADLKDLGGLSSATAGVILRNLITFEDQGAGDFFGEPEFETSDLLRTAADGKGMISCLELPQVQDRPQLFSTFLMWMLADLFHDLPEEGDLDKPKLVFFFDEAHLLFNDASKAFLQAIEQTVRLIRSKGVGVFFVTQSPKDVPAGVLAQLGNRVQHALRAFTPDDAKALKQAIATYPHTAYDMEKLLTSLGIGEAVVTVLSDRGVPTPVAWTRMKAPNSLMDPSPQATMDAVVGASQLKAKYAAVVDRESAYEKLAARLQAAPAAPAASGPGAVPGGPRSRVRAEARPQGGAEHHRAGRRQLGVQVDAPLRRHGHRPRDHPQPLRHAPPLTTRRTRCRRGRRRRRRSS